MNKFFRHLGTVNKHRKAVRKWCFKMGIPFRGLLHDLSKYSLKELSQYKYYTGKCSPHATMRDKMGYSTSWYKHRNKNKHHWEHWIDSLEARLAVKMPYKYVIEMLCDMAGAGRTYNPNWKPSDVKVYYDQHNGPHRIIHNDTRLLFEYLLDKLASFNDEKDFFKWYKANRKKLKCLYKDHTGFKWLYRLESKSKSNGLWYDSNSNYVWGIGKLENCKTKDLPMGYDHRYHKDGKDWFSSCSNKEDLAHWYSLKDAQDLIQNGFVFTKYLAGEFCEYELETCFLKESCLAREIISIKDIMEA